MGAYRGTAIPGDRAGARSGFDAVKFDDVVGVDLANNTVAVISGASGAVRTYSANSIAKQDMLKKIKVGDVVIGMTTPLMITSITK